MKRKWYVDLVLYEDDEDGCKSRNNVQVGPEFASQDEAEDWFAAVHDWGEGRWTPEEEALDDEPMGTDSTR